MKNYKLLFILLFAFITKGYNQTYTIKIDYDASSDGCHAAGYSWDFKGNTSIITSFGDGGNNMEVNESQTFTAVPNYSSFSFSLHSSCVALGSSTTNCNNNFTATKTAVQMLQGGYLGLGGCNGGVNIDSFKPNVVIQNLDTTDPSNICAGFSLSLAGFPANFPAEAYHWQYSVNNQVTWIDVPATIAGRATNNTPTPTFSMQELLGVNHTNYINKPIYFRLGYATTSFTTPLILYYSACTPVVTNIEYEAPNCNGDAIPKVAISFDRPLDNDETLVYIYIRDKNNGAISNQRNNVVFDTADPKKYTFYNISPLENTRTYEIGYQAKKGTIMRGSMFSTQSFTYNDPAKMQFKVTGQSLPTCFGNEDATIDIEILSGESPYNFYVDNVLTTASKIDNSHYKITGLKANAVGYKIKVTDKNNCIEK
ncbi:hypothetical protein [Flavobacterium chryseum]|uniref:hypothetical protein n=1 Tax=Flavobacterium sp. P3160 TaxID=2512113 RepID=UPI0010610E84|nr:hypothetical protein [Flavobacterium sp. P3160]